MNIHTGNLKDYKPIKLVNNKYVINWGLKKINESTYQWNYFILDNKPSIDIIKETIQDYINENTKYNIENSFYWNNMNIKLTLENQIDFKLLFDTTVLQDGSNLPEKLKFNINGEKIYYEIEDLEEFKSLIIAMNNHIRTYINKGNDLKDSIDYNEYK